MITQPYPPHAAAPRMTPRGDRIALAHGGGGQLSDELIHASILPRLGNEILNELLEEYAVRPYLSDHDGSPWHLHVAKPGATWGQWLAATTALGLAGFAAGHGFAAIGTCAAVDCERVFVNAAERRPRRFCSPTCSSRTRVASYRARRSGEREA